MRCTALNRQRPSHAAAAPFAFIVPRVTLRVISTPLVSLLCLFCFSQGLITLLTIVFFLVIVFVFCFLFFAFADRVLSCSHAEPQQGEPFMPGSRGQQAAHLVQDRHAR